ncbi:MAG TPA: ATPase, T2SS/T4P/T4SS family [Planctomycetaceae bacterium]|nr:ATPase, T2SS/T4P/T4SS family [Planctomycetaceae bacterium]
MNLLITQAIQDRASDIHIEPTERDLRVRFRIDGVLHEVMRPSTTGWRILRKRRRSSSPATRPTESCRSPSSVLRSTFPRSPLSASVTTR